MEDWVEKAEADWLDEENFREKEFEIENLMTTIDQWDE